MNDSNPQIWLDAMVATVHSYRRMIDATVAQLSDEELHARPAESINSVAILLRHLGGNLHSRWSEFLTADGEKPSRDRDQEFQAWQGDRQSLLSHFDTGWHALTSAMEQIDAANIDKPIFIRGESHTIPQALTRSITHITYHTGQIAIVARMVHDGPWQWLTIAPGQSADHNQRTWGTTSSRGILGEQ